MADVKIDATQARQIALAAAQGVAIALSQRASGAREDIVWPHPIICGIPRYMYEVVLEASPSGGMAVKSVTPQGGG